MASDPLSTPPTPPSANASPAKAQSAPGNTAQGFATLIADANPTDLAVASTMRSAQGAPNAVLQKETAPSPATKSSTQTVLPELLGMAGNAGENARPATAPDTQAKSAGTPAAQLGDTAFGKAAVQADDTHLANMEMKDDSVAAEMVEEPQGEEPQGHEDEANTASAEIISDANAPDTHNPAQPIAALTISPDAARQRDAALKEKASQDTKSATAGEAGAKGITDREKQAPLRSIGAVSELPSGVHAVAARLGQETEALAASDNSTPAGQLQANPAASSSSGAGQLQPHRGAETVSPVISARPGRFGEELGVAIARHTRQSRDKPLEILTLRLDPPEHGRIEVKLTFEDGAPLRASVLASQPGTLDLLRRDSADLMRALSQNGIGTDAQSFQFDSRGQNAHQERPSAHLIRRHAGPLSDDADNMTQLIPGDLHYRPLRSNGAVNLIT